MSWTPPRTWSPGETVTASIMNAHVRDNFNAAKLCALIVSIGDAAGGVITTGPKAYVPIPFKCTITGWTIIGDASGAIVVDIWKDTYANAPPTVGDSIAGSEKPTLTAQQKNQDLSLTTWSTTVVDAGDILGVKVDSASTVKQVTLVLHLERS